jgi:hypothetical protein
VGLPGGGPPVLLGRVLGVGSPLASLAYGIAGEAAVGVGSGPRTGREGVPRLSPGLYPGHPLDLSIAGLPGRELGCEVLGQSLLPVCRSEMGLLFLV